MSSRSGVFAIASGAMNKFSTSLTYAAVATTISLSAFGVSSAHAVGFSGAYVTRRFKLLNIWVFNIDCLRHASRSITEEIVRAKQQF